MTKFRTIIEGSEIVTVSVDVPLLRQQRDWLLTLGPVDEAMGLVNMIDSMLDEAEEVRDEG